MEAEPQPPERPVVPAQAPTLPMPRRPSSPGERLGELHPKRFFVETWRQMDAEAAEERRAWREAGRGYDYRPLVALCAGAAFLTLMEYFGGSRTFMDLGDALAGWLSSEEAWLDFRRSRFSRLAEYAWWSGVRFAGYFLLPVLVIKAGRERIRDHGLSFRGFFEHAWVYVLAFVVVLGLVVAVSFNEEFSSYYPFYEQASRSYFDFAAWELLYGIQFFSLEFFFRGFWLRALKTSMGSHAIFAMTVPYCMIHFGKPWLEALAAIVAGVVLGTLAMKTRSIWSGFLIHVSVALSMDVAALMQTDGLPDRLWPEDPPRQPPRSLGPLP